MGVVTRAFPVRRCGMGGTILVFRACRWYEDDVTRPRVCPHSTAPPLRRSGPPIRHSREGRNPEGVGMGKCSAGACPPLGSGCGGYRVAESAATTRCTKSQLQHFIPWCAGRNRHERLVRKHVPDSDPGCAQTAFERAVELFHSSFRRRPESRGVGRGGTNDTQTLPATSPTFSHVGVPAAAGMSDWYENDVTRLRVCLNATALVAPAPQFVIPAKAGIHALTFRERTSTAIPPPTSTRRPHFVFPAKAPPEPRYGAGIQRGVGGANFHTLVCRPLPA